MLGVSLHELESNLAFRKRRRSDIDTKHRSKPRIFADALVHHLFLNAASAWIVMLWPHGEILVSELAPDTEDFHTFGGVTVDKEVVPHRCILSLSATWRTTMMMRRIMFVGLALFVAATAFALAAAARVEQIETTAAPRTNTTAVRLGRLLFWDPDPLGKQRHGMRHLPPPGFRLRGRPRPVERHRLRRPGTEARRRLEGSGSRGEAQFTDDSERGLQRRR